VAIAKKKLNINASLYSFLQIISISIFEKEHINQLVSSVDSQIKDYESSKAIPNQIIINKMEKILGSKLRD
jgi:hypothetical protein